MRLPAVVRADPPHVEPTRLPIGRGFRFGHPRADRGVHAQRRVPKIAGLEVVDQRAPGGQAQVHVQPLLDQGLQPRGAGVDVRVNRAAQQQAQQKGIQDQQLLRWIESGGAVTQGFEFGQAFLETLKAPEMLAGDHQPGRRLPGQGTVAVAASLGMQFSELGPGPPFATMGAIQRAHEAQVFRCRLQRCSTLNRLCLICLIQGRTHVTDHLARP